MTEAVAVVAVPPALSFVKMAPKKRAAVADDRVVPRHVKAQAASPEPHRPEPKSVSVKKRTKVVVSCVVCVWAGEGAGVGVWV